jgi:predicted permease
MGTLFQDIRFGLRGFRRNPVFTIVVVATLALGIGANVAVFSLVNAVLLRPLPFTDPDRLVAIEETHPEIAHLQVAVLDFHDWQAQAQSFTGLGAYSLESNDDLILTDAGEPEQLRGSCVTSNLFPLLGMSPALGRTFTNEEEQPGRDRVVMISNDLWQRRFGANRDLVGSTIRLNGESHLVVGVMPPGVQLPPRNDVWLPISRLGQGNLNSRVFHTLAVVGRLKPNVTPEQARREMETIATRLQQSYPATNKTIGVALSLLQQRLTGDVKQILWALFGIVALVLLVTCANISNLLLVRAEQRRREIVVRATIGAGRLRLFRQFLTESLLLALAGGSAGVCLALLSLLMSRMILSQDLSGRLLGATTITLDFRVLGFAFLAALITGLLFGTLPALQFSRLNLNQALKETSRVSPGRAQDRTRRALIVAEVSLAMIALVGAGLLIRSFQGLLRVEPGFRTDHLITAELTLPQSKYSDSDHVKSFDQRLLPAIAALPGVTGVATVDYFPLTTSNAKTRFAVQGAPQPPSGLFPVAQLRFVSASYFQVMGVPLLNGRAFTEDDVLNDRNVCIINEAMARRHFGNENPIGKRIIVGVLSQQPTELPIVGAVGDVKDLGLDLPAEPELFLPGYNSKQVLMVRTTGDATGYGAPLRRAVLSADSEQPLHQVRTMDDFLSASVANRRLSAMLTALFALIALIVAGSGIYAVVSSTVTERKREIAIRMALGSQYLDISKLMMARAMKPTLLGIAIGLLVSIAFGRLLKGLLFGIGSADPLTLAATSMLFALTASLASYLPSRQATRMDPARLLRSE